MVLLGSHGPQHLPLDLPCLVVEEDPDEDQQGASSAEDGDVVVEHDDAQPHGQGVLDGTGNTAEDMKSVSLH